MTRLFMKFKEGSIKQKLIGSFGLIIALLFVSVSGVVILVSAFSRHLTIQKVYYERVVQVGSIKLNMANIWQYFSDASLTQKRSVIDNEVQTNFKQASDHLSKLLQSEYDDPQINHKLEKLKRDLPLLVTTGKAMFAAYGESREAGDAEMKAFDVIAARVISQGSIIAELLQKELDQWEQTAEARAQASVWLGGSLVLIAAVLALAAALMTISDFCKSIARLSRFIDGITQGQFWLRIMRIDNQKNEFNKIYRGLNGMLDQMETFFREINQSVEHASQNKYYRKPISRGLKGNYVQALDKIGMALTDQETAQIKLEKDRQMLVQSVDRILNEMEKLSNGDLTAHLAEDQPGAIGELFKGFNKTAQKFNTLLGQVAESVQSTVQTSSTIGERTRNISEGAHEQSGQTLGIAGAVEEMTATVQENSKSISVVSEIADKSGKDAAEGGNIVRSIIERMNKIAAVVGRSAETIESLGKRSNEIGEIIQAIQEIADQTNLLALNAAIEAARAGEQGRGFAVVADEVRKLAERTTIATKDITAKISNIQEDTSLAVSSMGDATNEVQSGKESVAEAGTALESIINNSEELNNMILQIASASEEQSLTSEEISKNIDRISSVSRDNANDIEEIVESINELNSYMERLQSLVNQFEFSESSHSQTITVEHGFAGLPRTSANEAAAVDELANF